MIPLSGLIFWVDVIVKLFTKNACLFYKFWKRLLVKSLLAKSFKKTFHSAYTESHKYMFRIFFFFSKFRGANHTSCKWKLIISYSTLS